LISKLLTTKERGSTHTWESKDPLKEETSEPSIVSCTCDIVFSLYWISCTGDIHTQTRIYFIGPRREHEPPLVGKDAMEINIPPQIEVIYVAPSSKQIPYLENIQKRYFTGPSRCSLYKMAEETNNCLFIHFPYTWSVWTDIIHSLGSQLD
jgi:hypothetical protein